MGKLTQSLQAQLLVLRASALQTEENNIKAQGSRLERVVGLCFHEKLLLTK
jgi:hypothetical protein